MASPLRVWVGLLLVIAGCAGSHAAPEPLPPPSDAFCTDDGFCWHTPRPQGNAIWGADAFDDRSFVAAGELGTIVFTDGEALTRIESDSRAILRDVWMDGPRSAWIAGDDGLYRWEGGARAERVELPREDASEAVLGGVSGVAPDVVWVGAGHALFAWDGSAFRAVALPPDLHPEGQIADVIVVSRDEAWLLASDNAIAEEPVSVIYHWAGGAWTESARALGDSYPWAVYGLSQTLDGTIWADGIVCFRYDGSTWIEVEPMASTVGGLWGTGPDLVWAPDGAVIGSAIPALDDARDVSHHAIAGASASAVLIGGESGVLRFFDGTRWTSIGGEPVVPSESEWGAVPPRLFAGPYAVDAWGTGARELWRITGASRAGNTIERWDGTAWIEELPGTWMSAIDGSAADDVWAAAGDAVLHRGRSGAWSRIDTGGLRVEGVWSAGEGRAWAVGRSPIGGEAILIEGDAIVRRDPLEVPATMIAGRAIDDVWAAASDWTDTRYHTTLFHFDGASWTVAARLDDVGASAIDAAPGVVRLVSLSTLLERSDGGAWTSSELGVAAGYLWHADDGATWAGRGVQAVVRR